ncbi:MAG: FKBP-type peptidyl-prolyl cis-trans isomerase, partial [Armatimonadota bacterium]|nr:FKBP-type peptidyl-prolyl cis-trans isomerase [Armatimonadota bacterium]
ERPLAHGGNAVSRKKETQMKICVTPLLAGALLVLALAHASAATGKRPAPAAKGKPAPTGTSKPAPTPARPASYTNDRDKLSYVIGFSVGTTLKRDLDRPEDVNPAVLLQGLQAALAGAAPAVSDDDAQRLLTQLQAKVNARQEERAREAAQKRQEAAARNLSDGNAFLEANARKEGVVVLPSGLQYQVLSTGTGPIPRPTDAVTVHYRGTLIDGTEFDSSYKHGQPATLALDSVIKGWSEALSLMPVGSRWRLFIPPHLAYGERGAGPVIGPNAVLIFEVELLSVNPGDTPQQ